MGTQVTIDFLEWEAAKPPKIVSDDIFVDFFAGGGGASCGIEAALGRSVSLAVNHDRVALALHKVNHPNTKHMIEDVWGVDPIRETKGKNVIGMWLSPDCKDFSKAKGGKPKDKNIRSLAWVAVKWASFVKPKIIYLENVEEFQDWGPIDESGRRIEERKGETFRHFLAALAENGYKYEYRELSACDYGAPTTRKRFFMIARCDGKPIVWPEPTHGDPESKAVRKGEKLPWRTAASIIDWSIPCPCIFDTKEEIYEKYGVRARRPLADNTLSRVVRGCKKFVVDDPNPFIVEVNHAGKHARVRTLDAPLKTVTAKNGYGIVLPFIARIGQQGFGGDKLQYQVTKPLTTVVTKQEHCLVTPKLVPTMDTVGNNVVNYHELYLREAPDEASNVTSIIAPFITKNYGGGYTGAGSSMREFLHTITAWDHNSITCAFISRQFGTGVGRRPDGPLLTTTAVNKSALVMAFLIKYYGNDVGQRLDDPLHTITSKARFGLVTIHGIDYEIVDIGFRMLTPEELKLAQGFPESYVIDHDCFGNVIPINRRTKMIGNSVAPQVAQALVEANMQEYIYSGDIAV